MSDRWSMEKKLFTPEKGGGSAVSENLERVYQMSPEHFFSVPRLISLGVPRNVAVRISNVLREDNQIPPGTETKYKTMREFLVGILKGTYSRFHYEKYFFRLPNLGRTSVDQVMRVLELSGIQNVPIETLEAIEKIKAARTRLVEQINQTSDADVKEAWKALSQAEAEYENIKAKKN